MFAKIYKQTDSLKVKLIDSNKAFYLYIKPNVHSFIRSCIASLSLSCYWDLEQPKMLLLMIIEYGSGDIFLSFVHSILCEFNRGCAIRYMCTVCMISTETEYYL